MHRFFLVALLLLCPLLAQLPHKTDQGFLLPNGWQITPTGRHVTLPDYVLNVSPTPDGKRLLAMHCGHSPHGLAVIDPLTMTITQEIPLKSAWLGLTWSPDGKRLYVSGGNGESRVNPTAAPIYVFTYADGKLRPAPVPAFQDRLPANQIYWSGLIHHPTKPWLFAANRGTQPTSGHLVVFHAETGERLAEYATGINPYTLLLDPTGDTLYVYNWGERSISVLDTRDGHLIAKVPVGHNPCDLALAPDHRLFVACSNENSIYVVDTQTFKPIEVIATAMHRQAPVGSTPNALSLDTAGKMLFVANADNNNVGVISIAEREISHVLGFIPTAWYPASLALSSVTRTSVRRDWSIVVSHNCPGFISPRPL